MDKSTGYVNKNDDKGGVQNMYIAAVQYRLLPIAQSFWGVRMASIGHFIWKSSGTDHEIFRVLVGIYYSYLS